MVKTGGGPKTPDFTYAEELALRHNRGKAHNGGRSWGQLLWRGGQ